MIRTLHAEHNGQLYEIRIDDTDDSESSDYVEIYSPTGEHVSSYDTCLRSDGALIAEALNEIGD